MDYAIEDIYFALYCIAKRREELRNEIFPAKEGVLNGGTRQDEFKFSENQFHDSHTTREMEFLPPKPV